MVRSVLLLAVLLSLGVAGQAVAQSRPSSSDGGDQEKRLQRLEEQIVDLSAQIGTVESLTRGGGGGGGASSGGGGDVESQLRAMSQQLNEIMRRLQQLERRSGMAPGESPNYGDAAPQQQPRNERQGRARPAENGTGFSIGGLDDQDDDDTARGGGAAGGGNNRYASNAPQPLQQRGSYGDSAASSGNYVAPSEPRSPSGGGSNQRSGWAAEPSASAPSGGSAAPSGSNSSGGLGSGGAARQAGGAAPVRTAALTSPQAQTVYDAAYGAYNSRNYRAATDGFEQFIQRYPNDPLAGSAQFWLGEAAFTGGDFRKAADMYLKTASSYPDNEKAAESLLKLGISLKRLGENDAACSTFSELGKRYPNASAMLQRADTEKRRSNC